MSVFISEERSNFFKNSGFPMWDATYTIGEKVISYPYVLYTCLKEDAQKIEEIQKASVEVARVFDKVSEEIHKWTLDDLKKWKFDPIYKDLLDLEWDDIFCMRVGWGWQSGKPKLLEINSQTPSFWYELEEGNRLLSSHFGLKDPSPKTSGYLEQALNQKIKQSLEIFEKRQEKPKVGFIVPNYHEDILLMKWMSKFCHYDFEVLTIEDLDFTKNTNIPFSILTRSKLDVLIFWHPMEWIGELEFANGDSFWKVFIEALKNKTFMMPHALRAFFIQSKSILAYITENEDRIFTGELKDAKKYFPKTYLTPESLGDTYFAKPIWGREGRGSYLVDKGNRILGRYQEEYYRNQDKVYQELLNLPKFTFEDQEITVIYEAWVYKVNGKFVPGGIGLRGGKHVITDDFCYFIPIGK